MLNSPHAFCHGDMVPCFENIRHRESYVPCVMHSFCSLRDNFSADSDVFEI